MEGEKLHRISFGNDFMDSAPENGQQGKKQTSETTKALHSKGNNQVKTQPVGWEKIFASHLSDSKFVSNT